MIDPAKVCLFIPPDLTKFKVKLFARIGEKIVAAGGRVARKPEELAALPREIIPAVGCTPYLRPLINGWIGQQRPWIYWDRGYARRVFATWMGRGWNGGFYRWHLNGYQMQRINKYAADRWNVLDVPLSPWAVHPKGHIVVALSSQTYEAFHEIKGWGDRTIRALSRLTDRQLVIRDKETKRPLQADLAGAYCMVAHGSIAAVESIFCGCPVVVDKSSAAALVGVVGLERLEHVRYPDRGPWVNALAYSQFNETELVDGTLWQWIS